MGHGANDDPIRADVNRAFSADLPDFSAPGALPQARSEDCAVGAKHMPNESAYANAIVAPRND